MQIYQSQVLQQAHEETYVEGRPPPPIVLPPKIGQDDFNLILKRISQIVGPENVHTGLELLHFNDPFGAKGRHIPSAAIWCVHDLSHIDNTAMPNLQSPASVEEVQRVLALANESKLPLWITSGGKNLGYGGPSPIVEGSAVLSLYRMSRILEVDEKNGYAIVEPGVTFYDLSQYCISKAPSVWPSMTFIAWGSVIGNVRTQLALHAVLLTLYWTDSG